MSRFAVAVPLALLGLVLIRGTTLPASAQETPTVVGSWVLNVDRSDDVREKVAAAMRNSTRDAGSTMGGRSGGRSGGAGRTGGSRGGQTGGAMDPPGGAAAPGPMGGMAMLQGPRELRIEIAESKVTLRRDAIDPLELNTDGKAVVLGPSDNAVEYKAKWNGQKLEIETRTKDGPRVVETYELDRKDPAVLAVDVRFTQPGPNGNLNVRLNRVYDRS